MPAASITTSASSPSPGTAPKCGARARRSGRPPTSSGRPPASTTQAQSISPIGPAPTIATRSPASIPARSTPRRQHASGSTIAATSGASPAGTGRRLTRAIRSGTSEELGVGAVQELERPAAVVAGGRVRRHDPPAACHVDPAELVPERARELVEEQWVPAPEGLEVGSVGERDLDLDEHVAGAWLRPRHFLEPQIAGAVEPKRPHGVKTTLSARAAAIQLETLREALEREHGRHGKLELREQRGGLAHRGRSRRAGADERELAPVDLVEVDRARVREHEHRPARRESVERSRGGAEDERVDLPPGARPSRSGRMSIAKTSSPRRRSTSANRRPMKPCPTTSTRSARNPLDAAKHASERLDVGAGRVVDLVRKLDALGLRRPAPRSRRARSSARRSGCRSTRGRLEQRAHSPHGRWWRSATRAPSVRRATTSCPSTVPAGATPSFSTSEPQRPVARTAHRGLRARAALRAAAVRPRRAPLRARPHRMNSVGGR